MDTEHNNIITFSLLKARHTLLNSGVGNTASTWAVFKLGQVSPQEITAPVTSLGYRCGKKKKKKKSWRLQKVAGSATTLRSHTVLERMVIIRGGQKLGEQLFT